MRPVKPAQPGQSMWTSYDLPLHSSIYAGRTPASPRREHKTRHESSMLSHNMPDEIINMTAPYVATSPRRGKIQRDLRADIRQRNVSPPERRSQINPPKFHLNLYCHSAPVSPRYSKDADLYDRKINNGDLMYSSFSTRDNFDQIQHNLKKKEALELIALKMSSELKKNKQSRKPMVLDMTSHKYIGTEPKMVYLRHMRNDDMRMHEAKHLKHDHHSAIPYTFSKEGQTKFSVLHRATSLCHDKNETCKWQSNYTHACNKPSWAHMEHRHAPMGEKDAIGLVTCPECFVVTPKSNTLLCRSCGAFPDFLNLPSTSSSQYSPRNVGGLDLSDVGLHRKEHQYAVGMTKKEHAESFKLNKDLSVNLHRFKMSEKNAIRRRNMSGFRHFGGFKNRITDIGNQISPRYRDGDGINKQKNGYKMLARRAGRGDARVEAVLSMASTVPISMKQFGIAGPIPKK